MAPDDDEIDRLAAAFDRLPACAPPAPPAGFADGVVAAVLRDRRRRLARLRYAAMASAAAVLFGGGLLFLRPPPKSVETVVVVPPEVPAPVSLRAALGRAGDAVAGLTRRAAEETAVGPALALLSPAEPLPPVDVTPWPDDLAPALDEVRRGASASLEPVTRAAGRAAQLFLSEWPLDADRRGPS